MTLQGSGVSDSACASADGMHDVDTSGIRNPPPLGGGGGLSLDPHKVLRFDPDARWVTADYRAGDVVILTMHT